MLLLLCCALPLLLGGLLLAGRALPEPHRDRVTTTAARLAPFAALPALILPVAARGGPEQSAVEVPGLLLGTSLILDETSRPLVVLTALLHAAALATIAWRPAPGPRDRSLPMPVLSAFLLLCLGGTLGVFLAADLVTFYVAFAVMSFAAAGLVIHHLDRAAVRATRVYLVLSVLSETALLAAVLMVGAAGGLRLAESPAAVVGSDHTGLILALLGFGLGIKAGVVPLHLWLPLAHPAAPPAASAVLSGALVTAGLLGFLRFSPELAQPGAGAALMVVAAAGGLFAVAVGVLQTDPKVVLAYSTVSQMGLMTAVAAVAVVEPSLAGKVTAAVVVYAVHHGLVKGALFLAVPLLSAGGSRLLRGAVAAGTLLAGLSLVGAPLTTGWAAKYATKDAVAADAPALEAVLPFFALGSALLMVRLVRVLPAAGARNARNPGAGPLGAWAVIVLGGAAVPWWMAASSPEVSTPGFDAAAVGEGLWPPAVAAVLSVVAILVGRRISPPAVPAGDLVMPAESAVAQATDATDRGLRTLGRAADSAAEAWRQGWSRAAAAARALGQRADSGLEDWIRSGAVLLALLAAGSLLVLISSGGGGG
ncbi:proton-conducting transporter membrane subunit [Nesterenkonia sp. CL21]|uniref:proton-conducting transporter transmembrane domain-containing protein n=1 Tax=Nesterenkonia sp. CL21 TaxID=3064894 RepID=UPI00287B2883|nr:proton-conducting transporter membrane subunit [Nesterenkonia sp. CL21]MDS2174255.1 proton-conducting transporter membrane subunit [Nesterenkonia sp. CL21]